MADRKEINDPALSTVAPGAPVTSQRPVTEYNLGIPYPQIPRALVAPDAENPSGTPGYNNRGLSVLQQHVAFFDRNNDGIIYPWETFQGFRAIGFNLLRSFFGMVFINGALSYCTQDSWLPSPLFSLLVKNIHKAKHGSDSEVYDTEGRFVPEKFEEIFTKFAKTEPLRLSSEEVSALVQANRNAYDPFGSNAANLEWSLAYSLLKDKDGFLTKEAIRGVYDGSIFYEIERKRQQSKMEGSSA
ncbi:hypothetical protein BDL97_15G078600 [Sphagnum fallax]|jgi:peroxygenase|uniref:Caleosin n=1 Tax=Sphagnum jensenii TaxID=128206 RepID=A0ABP0W8W9_9BRYO|nr:hypothetical protein BDL97_15G078600 [Sphagnum fallax]